jgi:hypothetical protein
LGSSDAVKGEWKGSRVEGRLLVEGATRTPRAWLTTFNGDPLGAVRNFWDNRTLMPPCKELIEIGMSDTVKRRAEGVEGRLLIEGATRTPSAWLTTFNGDPLGCFAPFGTTEC